MDHHHSRWILPHKCGRALSVVYLTVFPLNGAKMPTVPDYSRQHSTALTQVNV